VPRRGPQIIGALLHGVAKHGQRRVVLTFQNWLQLDIGHTHHQFDRTVGDLRIVNAGSVGMAYEDDVAAYWTLVEDGEPRPMRTPFDVERAVRETRASRWPNAAVFVAENLLQAVSREEAIAAQEKRR